MKILFCIRNDYLRNFGGDSMQAIKTAEHLRKIGIKVDINNGQINDYSHYDLIHLFNLTRMGETYKYYKIAKFYKKNIVISPVYWDLKNYYNHVKDFESIKLWNKCRPYRNQILRACKMSFPNSKAEGELLKKEFGKNIKYTTIYNGVEVESEDVPLYNFKERYRLDDYVLCVGRICKRKNQLLLADICNKLNIQLVLIGNVNDREYFNKCMSFKNVTYLGFMDSYNIYNAYRFAKLHVLPSFIETPGLSSLEAAASGCNIVTTCEGSGREYFKDMAIYCNPYNDEDVFKCVKQGIKISKKNDFKNFVQKNYNWSKCIKTLYDSYIKISNL